MRKITDKMRLDFLEKHLMDGGFYKDSQSPTEKYFLATCDADTAGRWWPTVREAIDHAIRYRKQEDLMKRKES